MYRQIIGYIPANVIPALISVVMIYAYTRLLSPAAFGAFSYVFTGLLVLQTSLFYALPIAVMRFYPGAVRDDRAGGLLREAYLVFYLLSAMVIMACVCAGMFFQLVDNYRAAVWITLPLLLFRSLVQLNQAISRSANQMRHFNSIECVHAALGFALGLAAIYLVGPGAEAILLGMLVAAVFCSLLDVRLLVSSLCPSAGVLNHKELLRLVEYSWPLVAVAATAMILQNGDRFLLGSLAGAEVLGIYAVAYNLVERPTTLICLSISTATFPLVVQVLEHEGKEAARLQSGRNGIALLAVALPACLGLSLTADYIASSLVGPAFRSGVAALIPIMSFTALARGLRTHFVDHAFHLSGRPLLMLWTYVPATVLNIALNLYVVPRYGMYGAALTGLLCQVATLVGGWFLGTSLFPVWLPLGQVLRCVLAAVPMALGLMLIRFSPGWLGLFSAIGLGGLLYVVSAALLDVGQMRSLIMQKLRLRVSGKVPALSD